MLILLKSIINAVPVMSTIQDRYKIYSPSMNKFINPLLLHEIGIC
jgi:hypothetical protein